MLAASSSAPLSPSSAASTASPSLLLRLPAALLAHVCGCLSLRQLLVTIVHASKTTCDVLPPACFSHRQLELSPHELSQLAAVPVSAFSVSLSAFHSRLLADCRLSVDISSRDSSVHELLDALDHFPACHSLRVRGVGPGRHMKELTDFDLYSLLHHPTVLSCSGVELTGFTRPSTDLVPVDGAQWAQLDVRAARAKRKRDWRFNLFTNKRRFEWTQIRLPAATRLSLIIYGPAFYNGGPEFLTAHTALTELDISTQLALIEELTTVFQNPAVLPQLTRLSLHETADVERHPSELVLLVAALATTVVGATGRPRPVRQLELNLPAPSEVFAAAALIPDLVRLRVDKTEPGWLTQWTATPELLTAFPLLQECIVDVAWAHGSQTAIGVSHPQPAATDMLLFMQSMASRPLQLLQLCTGERVKFSAAAMAELARCQQLRELRLQLYAGLQDGTEWTSWRDVALCAALTRNCFPCLRSIALHSVRLSAESVVAIAAAAPQLHELMLSFIQLKCHPAVACAIVGGYCEHIESITVDNDCTHVWSDVRAHDIVVSYQSAVAAAGRDGQYRPFTQLRYLYTEMCWCTPPSVWHALLSLLRWATLLSCVDLVASDDPLLICALSYLPSLRALSGCCMWPPSFATVIERRYALTGRYRYLASSAVSCSESDGCIGQRYIELSDSDHDGLVQLRARSSLFAAYQRSLRAEQQAVLARWARGDFQAGDEQLSGAENAAEPCDEPACNPVGRRVCPHSHSFIQCYTTGQ